MAGTHYTLDRDKPENQNPMALVKEKACDRCCTVKPNTFQFFGKKLWKTRHDLTTTDVCISCQKAKVSASMKAKWAARRVSEHTYQEEQLRVARSLYEANQPAKPLAVSENALDPVKPLAEDSDDAPGITRIGLSQALDLSDTGKTYVDHRVDTNVRGPVPKSLTVSDLVARDLESKK